MGWLWRSMAMRKETNQTESFNHKSQIDIEKLDVKWIQYKLYNTSNHINLQNSGLHLLSRWIPYDVPCFFQISSLVTTSSMSLVQLVHVSLQGPFYGVIWHQYLDMRRHQRSPRTLAPQNHMRGIVDHVVPMSSHFPKKLAIFCLEDSQRFIMTCGTLW